MSDALVACVFGDFYAIVKMSLDWIWENTLFFIRRDFIYFFSRKLCLHEIQKKIIWLLCGDCFFAGYMNSRKCQNIR